MRKKVYQEPAMLIVKLQHTGVIMTSVQNGQVSVQDYTMHDATEEVKAQSSNNIWDEEW